MVRDFYYVEQECAHSPAEVKSFFTFVNGDCLNIDLSTLAQWRQQEPTVDALISAHSLVSRAAVNPGNVDESKLYYEYLSQGLQRLREHSAEMPDEMFILCNQLVQVAELVRTCDPNAMLKRVELFIDGPMQEWQDQSVDDISSEDQPLNSRQSLLGRLMPAYLTIRNHYKQISDALAEYEGIRTPRFNGFCSLEVATHFLEDIVVHWKKHRHPNIPQWITEPGPKVSTALLRRWLNAFQFLVNSYDAQSASIEDLWLIRSLRVHSQFLRLDTLAHQAWSSREPLVQDAGQISAIFEDYEWLLATAEASGGSLKASDIPISAIAPIYTFAYKARSPALRSQAMRLLQCADVVEGVWSSRVAYLVASAVMPVLDSIEYGLEIKKTPADVHLPHIGIQRANCTFDNAMDEASLTVILSFDEGYNTKKQSREITKRVKTPRDVAACRAAQWPLEAILQSNGYDKTNLASTPYLPSYETASVLWNRLTGNEKLDLASGPSRPRLTIES